MENNYYSMCVVSQDTIQFVYRMAILGKQETAGHCLHFSVIPRHDPISVKTRPHLHVSRITRVLFLSENRLDIFRIDRQLPSLSVYHLFCLCMETYCYYYQIRQLICAYIIINIMKVM